MKRISILKTIVTIAFVICSLTVVFGVPFTLMLAVAQDYVPKGLRANISANQITGTGAIIYLLLSLGSAALLAFALRTLRESLTLFEKRIFFDTRVVTQLTKTGNAFFAAAMLHIASELVSVQFASTTPHVQVSLTYGPTLLFCGLGLLFLVLSDVFGTAKKLKEENDLTV